MTTKERTISCPYCERDLFPDNITYEQDMLDTRIPVFREGLQRWELSDPVPSPMDSCGWYCQRCHHRIDYTDLDPEDQELLETMEEWLG